MKFPELYRDTVVSELAQNTIMDEVEWTVTEGRHQRSHRGDDHYQRHPPRDGEVVLK